MQYVHTYMHPYIYKYIFGGTRKCTLLYKHNTKNKVTSSDGDNTWVSVGRWWIYQTLLNRL